jgi:hypothetical protein
VCHAGTGGVGERIGRSGRIAADRVRGEDRRADKPRLRSADQGRCCPAGRSITGARQACGSGQEQRSCHREVCGLDPAEPLLSLVLNGENLCCWRLCGLQGRSL